MSNEERRAFESHLAAGCALCDRELRELDSLVTMLASAVPAVEPGNVTRIETMAGANDKLGELDSQDIRDVKTLVSDIEENFDEFMQSAEKWQAIEPKGLYMRTLRLDKEQQRLVALMRMEPGVAYPSHAHAGGEQCIVLHGDLQIGDKQFCAGEYRWWEPGEQQPMQTTQTGCLLLVSTPLD